MFDDLRAVFDSWDILSKARQPKGLAKWDKLSRIAHRLEGKGVSAITFTCAHPTHAGQTHVLGSSVGNLHALLGYINPAFHMAPYHYQVMDPNLADDQADDLYYSQGHPSRPVLWDLSGVEADDEGDLETGEPHETVASAKAEEAAVQAREESGTRVKAGAGSYFVVPSEGLVYGEHNGHVYPWELVKDSFLVASHPELLEEVAAEYEDEDFDEEDLERSQNVPYMVRHRLTGEDEFAPEVYPLVKSLFPQPGSVLTLPAWGDTRIYATVGTSSLDFYDASGQEVSIPVYGRLCKSFDLTKGGNLNPSVLYNFMLNHLGVNRSDVEAYLADTFDSSTESPNVIKGNPTPGFEDVPSEYVEDIEKSVEVVGNTYRLIVRSAS